MHVRFCIVSRVQDLDLGPLSQTINESYYFAQFPLNLSAYA